MTSNSDPLARWVSIIGHPFVMVVLLTTIATAKRQGGKDAASALAFLVATAILPVGVFMYWQVRSGRWGTIDASRQSERPALYLLMLALLAALGLWLRDQPKFSLLSQGLVSAAVLLFVALVLNRWIKTSMHMAFASYVAVTMVVVAVPVGLALLLALPLLGWSRVAMRRHTLAEVVVGTVLGSSVALAAIAL